MWRDGKKAVLKAKLIDKDGNPVVGETVTFTMGVNQMYEIPKLSASLQSHPELELPAQLLTMMGLQLFTSNPAGSLPIRTIPDYDDSASGNCSVKASWNDMKQTLQLSWKNFPYLSVETEVTPKTVKVGETVEVTVWVKGDGYALMPTPIDAMLCTDRSGTMLRDIPDRMVSVMEASKAFTGAMQVNLNQDHVGLVSFGDKGMGKSEPGV